MMTPAPSHNRTDTVAKKSLATQLTWVSILTVTLSLALVGTMLIFIAERTQRESAFRLQQQSADQTAQLISDYMVHAVDRLRFFLKNTPLPLKTPEGRKAALENLLISSLPLYSQVSLLDTAGNEITKVSRFHTYLPGELVNWGQFPAFTTAMRGQEYMGPVAFLDHTGLLSVTVALPVRSPTAALAGVITAEVNASHLWQDVARIDVGRTGYAYLVDREGRFVAYQKPAEILQRYGEDMNRMPPVFEFVISGPDATGRVQEYEGLVNERVIGAHASIKGTHWAVVVEQPTREAYAGITDMKRYLIGLMSLCILMAGGLGFFVSRRLIGPIRTLTAAARRFGAGDLETEFAGVRRQDEVGVLSHAFEKMQSELQDLYAGLRAKVEELEIVQATLQKSEENYRLLAENITDNIWVLDPETLRFSYLSPSIRAITGYSVEEAMGLQLKNLLTPASMALATSVLEAEITADRQHTAATESHTLELEQYHKDGSTVWTEVSMRFIGGNRGRAAYILGVTRDISDRKRLQDQLQKSQKMESLGLMAAGIAHDLNNILSGIVSYPDLLLLGMAEDDPLRKPIETIQESGNRAAEVVSDLLTVARGVATGREILNVRALIDEYVDSAEQQKLARIYPDVSLKTRIDPDSLNVSSSPVHVKKSLMNLVANAYESIEGRGNVIISAGNRYLDEPLAGYEDVEKGEYVRVAVSDDGAGIPHKDLERIFEPFYTKKEMGRSGTGLGLTIVWNTVREHGGYVNVISDDRGTAFELYFPASREGCFDEKEKTPLEDYLGRGEKILVVDDEPGQREIATALLARLNYRVEAVSGGEAAVAYLKKNSVDLVVLDMIMPKGLNGRETYERIIKIHPGQKAVIASGLAETGDVKAAQALGAGKFIKKPYTTEKIGVAIREELSTRRE